MKKKLTVEEIRNSKLPLEMWDGVSGKKTIHSTVNDQCFVEHHNNGDVNVWGVTGVASSFKIEVPKPEKIKVRWYECIKSHRDYCQGDVLSGSNRDGFPKDYWREIKPCQPIDFEIV